MLVVRNLMWIVAVVVAGKDNSTNFNDTHSIKRRQTGNTNYIYVLSESLASPCPGSQPSAGTCSLLSQCPSGYYCQAGFSQSQMNCCPITGAGVQFQDSNSILSKLINNQNNQNAQPVGGGGCSTGFDPGQGNIMMQRWYFNRMNGNCESFLYRGAQGNANNYPTLKHCQVACMGHVWGSVAEQTQGVSSAFFGNPFSYGLSLANQPNQNIFYNTPSGGVQYNGMTIIPYSVNGQPTGSQRLVTYDGSSLQQLLATFNQRQPSVQTAVQLMTTRVPQFVAAPYDPLGIQRPYVIVNNNAGTTRVPFQQQPIGTGGGTVVLNTTNIQTYPASLADLLQPYLRTNRPQFITQRPFQQTAFPTQQTAFPQFQQQFTSAVPCSVYTLQPCNELAPRPTTPFRPVSQTPPRPSFTQPATVAPQQPPGNNGGGPVIYVPSNPCCYGTPAVDNSGARYICVADRQCPPDYWCHVGASQEFTACCYGQDNACDQPFLPGSGPFSLRRWYFDSRTRQCIPFTYPGLLGSGNNFESEQECRQQCNAFAQPISQCATESLIGQSCSRDSDCPQDFWCHIGLSVEDNRCCRDLDIPRCQQPPDEGVGSLVTAVQRWYMDEARGPCGTCSPFMYRGVRGNHNNFPSRAACELACSRCSAAPPRPSSNSICAYGDPLTLVDEQGRPTVCSSSRPCPPDYECNAGSAVVTPVCCPISGNAQANLLSTYVRVRLGGNLNGSDSSPVILDSPFPTSPLDTLHTETISNPTMSTAQKLVGNDRPLPFNPNSLPISGLYLDNVPTTTMPTTAVLPSTETTGVRISSGTAATTASASDISSIVIIVIAVLVIAILILTLCLLFKRRREKMFVYILDTFFSCCTSCRRGKRMHNIEGSHMDDDKTVSSLPNSRRLDNWQLRRQSTMNSVNTWASLEDPVVHRPQNDMPETPIVTLTRAAHPMPLYTDINARIPPALPPTKPRRPMPTPSPDDSFDRKTTLPMPVNKMPMPELEPSKLSLPLVNTDDESADDTLKNAKLKFNPDPPATSKKPPSVTSSVSHLESDTSFPPPPLSFVPSGFRNVSPPRTDEQIYETADQSTISNKYTHM